MSRIGNAPVEIPEGVSAQIADGIIVVKGPKGETRMGIPPQIQVNQEGGHIVVTRKGEDKSVRALHGFVRAQINNDVVGVTSGWTKTLELSGVGYRAALSGVNLVLSVGFSHPVTIVPPQGITFAVTEGKIIVSGISRQIVGQTAASIRAVKKPEPYKGKGIKYKGEKIRKKAGKAAKAIGGAAGGAK